MAACKQLTAIHLQSNALTGPVPEGASILTDLRTLSVAHNMLTGLLPVTVIACFPQLKLCELLDNNLLVTTAELKELRKIVPEYCELTVDPADTKYDQQVINEW